MKHRLNSVIMGAVLAMLAANVPAPARAEETNETKQAAKPEKKVFFFGGGGPVDFILALDRHFRTRLGQILSIPSALTRAEVPKMRLATENPEDALKLYNSLQDPLLGEWRYDGPATNPSVLTLVPDRTVAAGKLQRNVTKVKAVGLAGVPEADWDTLQKDVHFARDIGQQTAENLGSERLAGSIAVQRESKVLIASGSEGFIEMVESVVAAHRSNAQIEKTASQPK